MNEEKTDQTKAILALDVDDVPRPKPVRMKNRGADAFVGAVTGALTMLVVVIMAGVWLSNDSYVGPGTFVVWGLYFIASAFFMIVGPAVGALGGIAGRDIGHRSGILGPAVGGMIMPLIMFGMCLFIYVY